MDPILNWTGGKRWQVPMLKPLWDKESHRRLVEPFCGGLAVVLGLEPEAALLNDVNPHLINFYRWVQAGVPFGTWSMDAKDYYAHRDAFNTMVRLKMHATLPAAEHFYVLNQWCFNGLWRVNASGEFNVPRRPVTRPIRPFDADAYQTRFRDWLFDSRDFETFLDANLDLEDFVYADPPYDDGYTGYDAAGFTWDDQVRLAVCLSLHPGPIVLMNKATERILKLYDSLGFELTMLDAHQRMHHSRGSSGTVLEVMATSGPIDARDMIGSL